MVKKKKKAQKKKKQEEEVSEVEEVQEYSLDTALHSVKKTETTLQTLLKGVSEGQGFVHLKKEEEEKVLPHLSHESRSKIAEEFMLEEVPLSQRATQTKRQKTLIAPKTKEEFSAQEVKRTPSKTPDQAKPASTRKPRIEVKASVVQPPGKEQFLETIQGPPPTPPTKEKASFIKKENIYLKLMAFFEDLMKSYGERYDRWETSISNILAILRKMRKITKKNTDDLVVSISNLYKTIQANLEQFKIKRNEVERVTEVDIESMSGEFKRVLGLLELQIKEYRLKRVTDDLIHG